MWYLDEGYEFESGENSIYAGSEDEDSDLSSLVHFGLGELERPLGPSLNDKLLAGPDQFVRLFGTVPPRTNLDWDRVKSYAARLAKEIVKLEVDGIIVYDIQDEEGRGNIARPFAYAATHPSRDFAKLLLDFTGVETIVYRCVAHAEKPTFSDWLATTWKDYKAKSLVFVGGSSSGVDYPGLTVPEAARATRDHPNAFTIGGIMLPERHREKDDEHHRLLAKTKSGVSFFTTQVVYNVDCAIWVLRDYDELCKLEGITPARLVFVFAPFGRTDTVTFLKWLGVEIPLATEKRILSRKTRPLRIQESVDVCRANLRRILQAIEYYGINVPIGVAVETVSKYRDEYNAALQLMGILRKELDAFTTLRSATRSRPQIMSKLVSLQTGMEEQILREKELLAMLEKSRNAVIEARTLLHTEHGITDEIYRPVTPPVSNGLTRSSDSCGSAV